MLNDKKMKTIFEFAKRYGKALSGSEFNFGTDEKKALLNGIAKKYGISLSDDAISSSNETWDNGKHSHIVVSGKMY